jgi:ABC-type anion transport system duplicated permease subunit
MWCSSCVWRERRPARFDKPVMSLFVPLFNRLLWRPMYAFAESKLRLD